MASSGGLFSVGVTKAIAFGHEVFGLLVGAAKLAWFVVEGISRAFWWWGLRFIRFFGNHYVWLFLLIFFIWMWWQGGHLLLTMSNLIADYSTKLIEHGEPGQDYEGIRNLLLGLAALLSVPFFFLRTWINERQTRTQEQGHMTDRIAKAVEALGTEKQVKNSITNTDRGLQTVDITVPNLEVRIGAIYALERISQDSARDHWQVMEILTAYLRQNAGGWRNGPPPATPLGSKSKSQNVEAMEYFKWQQQEGRIRIDFQAIIIVLARRSAVRRLEEKKCSQGLDLRGVHLNNPDFEVPNSKSDFSYSNLSQCAFVSASLQFVNLRSAVLVGSDLRRANLSNAVLAGSSLIRANLSYADLIKADLTGAHLIEASLIGADLAGGCLIRAILVEANLSGANLREANLIGARLSNANLSGATLAWTDLARADLSGADLRGANLTSAELCETDFSGANLMKTNFRDANMKSAKLSDNIYLTEGFALHQSRYLDQARLPVGWQVRWDTKTKAWDITTPDGPYVDPRERGEES